MDSTLPVLVLLLVLLPFAAAALMPLFGRFARRAAMYAAVVHLAIVAVVVFAAVVALPEREKQMYETRRDNIMKFQPSFVPGDPGLTGHDPVGTYRTRWTLMSLTDAPPVAPGEGAMPYQPGPRIQFYLGIDGINIWLVALASLMMIPAILVSWDSVKEQRGGFYGWLFLLQGASIGAFLSFDVILFYAFFEVTLIPAYFLIARWGQGSGRRDAARKFFLYTLAGSLLTLVGLIGVVLTNPTSSGQYTFSLPDLMQNVQQRMTAPHIAHFHAGQPEALARRHDLQFGLFIALVAGFLVKAAVWPFHTWLPSAYNEAPLGVTILLSAVLAKLGTYGMVRFVLALTPDAAIAYGLPVVGSLAAFGIVYGAFCAFAQRDLKLMIAYSSISHLGLLVLGIFAFNTEGISGAVLHMVNHGIATGGMFALLAFFVNRYRTTDMRQFGGLMGQYPKFAFLAFTICMASIGLPGLNSFVSEMMILAGLFDARNDGTPGLGLAVVAAFGILLSAWYVLTMLQRVFFNAHREPPAAGVVPPGDATRHELQLLGGLAALCLFLGLFPQLLIKPMKADVGVLNSMGELARDRVAGRRPTPPPEINEPIRPGQLKAVSSTQLKKKDSTKGTKD